MATWRELLDGSRALDYEPALLETAKPVVARVAPETAEQFGLTAAVTVSGNGGWLTLPLDIVPGMAPDTVWVPTHAPDTPLSELGLVHGDPVTIGSPAAALERGEGFDQGEGGVA